jgi:hypothetical protein
MAKQGESGHLERFLDSDQKCRFPTINHSATTRDATPGWHEGNTRSHKAPDNDHEHAGGNQA